MQLPSKQGKRGKQAVPQSLDLYIKSPGFIRSKDILIICPTNSFPVSDMLLLRQSSVSCGQVPSSDVAMTHSFIYVSVCAHLCRKEKRRVGYCQLVLQLHVNVPFCAPPSKHSITAELDKLDRKHTGLTVCQH